MRNSLLDSLARACGYFTFEDVRKLLDSATKEAMKQAGQVDREPEKVSPSHQLPKVQSLPPGHIGYFVSYSHAMPGGPNGFGCIEIGRTQTVQSFADVQGMTGLIQASLAAHFDGRESKVVILNWQRFEAPLQPDGGREGAPREGNPAGVVLRLAA